MQDVGHRAHWTHPGGGEEADLQLAGHVARPGEVPLQQRDARHAVDERGQESALEGAQGVHHLGDLHLHDPVGPLLGDGLPFERLEGVAVGQDALRRRRTGITGFHVDHAFIGRLWMPQVGGHIRTFADQVAKDEFV